MVSRGVFDAVFACFYGKTTKKLPPDRQRANLMQFIILTNILYNVNERIKIQVANCRIYTLVAKYLQLF